MLGLETVLVASLSDPLAVVSSLSKDVSIWELGLIGIPGRFKIGIC